MSVVKHKRTLNEHCSEQGAGNFRDWRDALKKKLAGSEQKSVKVRGGG